MNDEKAKEKKSIQISRNNKKKNEWMNLHHYLWIYCIQSLQAQKPEAIIKAMMQKAEAFDGYCYCCITALPDMLDR